MAEIGWYIHVLNSEHKFYLRGDGWMAYATVCFCFSCASIVIHGIINKRKRNFSSQSRQTTNPDGSVETYTNVSIKESHISQTRHNQEAVDQLELEHSSRTLLGAGDVQCNKCGGRFKSLKALYAHSQVHKRRKRKKKRFR